MTAKPPYNPFVLTGYIAPEYFCDRERESAKLLSALQNGRNVTLASPRRMGKTGLIHHLFYQLKPQADVRCFYVDLYQTDSLQSLVKKLADTVLGSLDTRSRKLMKQVVSFFKSLRPVFTLDPMTGEPGLTVDISPNTAEYSLQEIFAYMEQSCSRCYVAFDEFQTVAEYANKRVEALLRTQIQQLTNVNFIFCGSKQHLLQNMFATAARPFYQSTQMMALGPIDADAYFHFACQLFENHGQKMEREAFDHLFDTLSAHTWYVHSILNRLYETAEPLITPQLVEEVLRQVVEENAATYQTFIQLITVTQARVLRAVAQCHSVKEMLSADFLHRFHLGAASTVRSAVKALVDRELLLQTEAGYQVYDRFLEQYLRIF
ncbi:MAG: ATP-binding protein [Muribaculaceae bacterium]